MTLDYQLVPIQWQGMDSKTDEKQLVPGKVALLQNMWMDRTGIIKKRFGFTQVSTINTDYAYGLADFNRGAATFATDVSAVKGQLAPNLTSSFIQTLTESDAAVVIPDGGAAIGVSIGLDSSVVISKSSSFNEITMYLIDNKTNSQISAAKGYGITVFAFCCFNASPSGGIVFLSDNAGQPGLRLARSSNPAILPDGLTSGAIDATATAGRYCKSYCYNDIVYVVYQHAGTTWKVAAWDINAGTAIAPITLTATGTTSADVYADANGVYAAYWNTNGGVVDIVIKRFTLNLGALTSTRTRTGRASPTFEGKIGIVADNDVIGLFSTTAVPTTTLSDCEFWDGTSFVKMGAASMASKPFLIKRNANNYPAALILADNAEGSVFLATPSSAFAPATGVAMDYFGGGFFGRIRWPLLGTTGVTEKLLNDPLSQCANFSPKTVLPELSFTNIVGGVKSASIAARIVKWETVAAPPPSIEQANTSLAGNWSGDVRFYDGFYGVKSGFFSRPRAPSLFSNTVVGAGLAAGTYLYCAVFEYIDNNGNLCRSAPSDFLSVVAVGPSRIELEQWIADFNRFPRVVGTSYSVGTTVAIYRTFANGTVFYRRYAISTTALSFTTFSLVDTMTDAALTGSTPLYTTGGILENVPAPYARSVAVGKSRVFAVSAQDEELWFSKKFVSGELPSFSDSLVMKLDAQGGNAVSVVEMDDKVIILKRSSILGIYGDGPDETGANPFQGPQVISTELGLVSDNASVLTDDGVMFKSDRGIYLINRGLQTDYIGKEVQEFNPNTVVSAHNLRDRDQTFFWTTEGNTCVYDSFHRIWSVYTGQICQDACLVDGVPHYLSGVAGASTVLLKEDKTVFSENGVAIPIVIRSGWMSMAGIQGFQRIRKLNFVGKSYAAHTVTVKLYYDFNDTEFETISVVSTTIMPGADGLYQYQIRPKRQKCEAFKFELSVSGTNQAFELSNFALEVGVKPKSNRMAAYKRVSS